MECSKQRRDRNDAGANEHPVTRRGWGQAGEIEGRSQVQGGGDRAGQRRHPGEKLPIP